MSMQTIIRLSNTLGESLHILYDGHAPDLDLFLNVKLSHYGIAVARLDTMTPELYARLHGHPAPDPRPTLTPGGFHGRQEGMRQERALRLVLDEPTQAAIDATPPNTMQEAMYQAGVAQLRAERDAKGGA